MSGMPGVSERLPKSVVLDLRTWSTRIGLFLLALGVLGACFLWAPAHAAAGLPQVELNVSGASPRQVEDATEQAIARDYAKAWQAMASARERNDVALLGSTFVGTAQEQLAQAIRDQQNSKLHVRYIDHGHKLQAIFYSQEGSALQLRDTAMIETQVLDGDKVVQSDSATINYVVLMTPAADHWQVRMLQAVGNFQ